MGQEKLTEQFKKEVLTPWWAKNAYRVKEEYGFDLAEEGLKLRYRAQTDLFWLCNILGKTKLRGKRKWKDYEIDTHQEMVDLFVSKDPSYRSFEEFAVADKKPHNRLLLVPRGGYKSTIDIVDCVQWTVCFPNIAMLVLTGRLDLAVKFVGEYTKYFTLQEDRTPRIMDDGKISLFQVLFPEHLSTENETKRDEYTTPARRADIKEPTIWAASIEQSLAGFHFDVLKLDDVVTEENSKTQIRLQDINRRVSVDEAMLHPYGYYDKIGTWYDISDLYGITLKNEEVLKADGREPETLSLVRAALWLKPEAIAKSVTEDTAKEDDYMIWFPEGLTYDFLMSKKRSNQETFAIKYLNNPLAAHIAKFSRELMVSRTVDTLPQSGVVFEAWDLGYSEKKSACYTVGIAGMFTSQGIYIIDMERGRYGEYELPEVMAAFAAKWKPRRVAVEDSMGARWLNTGIRQAQEKFRTHIPFEFVPLGKGTKTNSKEVKAKGAANLLGSGRLFFWKAMAGLGEIYNELESFPKGAYKDIVCSLSLLVNHFSNYADISVYTPISINDRMDRVKHDMIYGLGAFAPKVQDSTLIALQGPNEMDRDPITEAGLF